jgi:hypothetical protein
MYPHQQFKRAHICPKRTRYQPSAHAALSVLVQAPIPTCTHCTVCNILTSVVATFRPGSMDAGVQAPLAMGPLLRAGAETTTGATAKANMYCIGSNTGGGIFLEPCMQPPRAVTCCWMQSDASSVLLSSDCAI